MMISALVRRTLFASSIAAGFLPCLRVCADPDTVQDRPAYLISQLRFVDAADWVANSENQSDLKSLCARATLSLYVGQISQARLAFNEIQARTPASEPLSLYGLALCDMASGDTHDANAKLAECEKLDGYTLHQDEVSEAEAVIAQSGGDANKAASLLQSDDSLLAQELAAVRTLTSPSTQPDIATLHTPAWWLPGGVPRVVELDGIQVDAAVNPNAHAPILVGSLESTPFGDRILERLQPLQAAAAPEAKTVSGNVSVTPVTQISESDPNWVVSFALDGRTQAVLNTGERSWMWDTQSTSNGLHIVTISLDNGTTGQHFAETKYYKVTNKTDHATDTTPATPRQADLDPAGEIVINDAWDLLRIQPKFQPAELLLARVCRQRNLNDLGMQHDCVAAALDERAAGDQILEISHAYANRIPSWFKLPPGAHVAEHVKGGGRSYLSQGIWRGSTAVREIALTFDDGPTPDKTPPLLDALESVNCPATFMVVGIRAQVAPEILRRMKADGDEVEDHTYTHPNLDEATPEHIYEEILRDAAIIQACTGVWPHFLRPPGGQSNPNVLQIAQKLGLTGALWTVDVLPAEDLGSPQAVIDLVLKKAVPGAIILMHNGTYATTVAVPTLVKTLRARGYKLVTLLQIAKDTPGVND